MQRMNNKVIKEKNFLRSFSKLSSEIFLSIKDITIEKKGSISIAAETVRLNRIKMILGSIGIDVVRERVASLVNLIYYNYKEILDVKSEGHLVFLIYAKLTEEVYQNEIIKAFIGEEGFLGKYASLVPSDQLNKYSSFAPLDNHRDNGVIDSAIIFPKIATIRFTVHISLANDSVIHMFKINDEIKDLLNKTLTCIAQPDNRKDITRTLTSDYGHGNVVASEIV